MAAKKLLAHPVREHTFFTDTRLDRAPGLLANRPAIGWLMVIFGSLIFAGMVYNLLSQGPLLALDNSLAIALPAMALSSPVSIKVILESGFYIGKHVITLLGILLALYFIYKRYWQELVMLAVGLAGASFLFVVLSNFFARARPPTQIWIIEKIPGFPSGHSITTFAFYGLLAYWLVPKISSAFWKGIVIVAAILIITFVDFTRVFTAGHYLTDVLAGTGVGIAWSGLCYTLIELYFKKRKNQNVQKN